MKTIRWGMIGCGSVAEVKSGPGFYKATHSSLLAVTSTSLHKAQSFAERHQVAKVYASSAEFLADPEIDAVYIATPPSSHKALALLVAQAGKHVYVEKPMAMRFDECREIVDTCAAHQVQLFVAFYRRAMPRFLQVKQWIDDGAIGKVLCVHAVQHQKPAPEDCSRDTLPWRLTPSVSGGGKFLDMGVHMLDMFDCLFGKIETVHGIAANHAGLYDVEDTVSATWQHQSGVQGCGSWSYVCAQEKDRVEIIGTHGRIEFEFFSDQPLKLTRAHGSETLVEECQIANPQHVQQPFIQSIVDQLNGLAPCPGRVEAAVHSSWVADQILYTYRQQHLP